MPRLVIVMLLCACGHGNGDIDEEIGRACVSDRDCDSRCYIGGEFPGGFCSLPCVSDNDCPGDAYCIDHSGGVCMFACPPFDCGRLGPDWGCHDEPRANGSHVNVCSGG